MTAGKQPEAAHGGTQGWSDRPSRPYGLTTPNSSRGSPGAETKWTLGAAVLLFEQVSGGGNGGGNGGGGCAGEWSAARRAEARRVLRRQAHIRQHGLDVYGRWSVRETATLAWLLGVDLTLARLRREIPDKTPEQIRGTLLQISGNTMWTAGELGVVEAAAGGPDVAACVAACVAALPARSELLIRGKVGAARRRLAAGAPTAAKAAAEAKTAVAVVAKTAASSVASTAAAASAAAVEASVAALLARDDASRDAIEAEFTQPLRVAVDLILRCRPSLATDFTQGELRAVRGADMAGARWRAPLKSDAALRRQLAAEPVRRRTFNGALDELLYYAQWFSSDAFGRRAKRAQATGPARAAKRVERGTSRVARGRKRPRLRPAEGRVKAEADSEAQTGTTAKAEAKAEAAACGARGASALAFEPPDITHDVEIALFGRPLFVEAIRTHQTLPATPWYVDTMAARIVAAHPRCYTDMPVLFPPFGGGANPLNRVRLRYLLCPQHTELFVLAQPKSNELDPVREMQTLFQIHYGLYFAHSAALKRVIASDYCQRLEDSVEDSDFTGFMHVVDKWNALMARLSPAQCDGGDINPEVRVYLQEDVLGVTDEELRLEEFWAETRVEAEEEEESPEVEPAATAAAAAAATPAAATGTASDASGAVASACGASDAVASACGAPGNAFPTHLISRLASKTTVSRFAMQQILLQTYARVVLPDSQKLRSYKSFTAEVYGELLPGFVSEILTKLDFRPHHKFYDLGSGVGNTALQAAVEFGAAVSGGCELMAHASRLTEAQERVLRAKLGVFGLEPPRLTWALLQSFVANANVKRAATACDVVLVNNYLFDANLNAEVGRLLLGLRPGAKIVSLRNFIRPRYRASAEADTVFDYLEVAKFEMSPSSVSWTANRVPYYISTVQERVCPFYL